MWRTPNVYRQLIREADCAYFILVLGCRTQGGWGGAIPQCPQGRSMGALRPQGIIRPSSSPSTRVDQVGAAPWFELDNSHHEDSAGATMTPSTEYTQDGRSGSGPQIPQGRTRLTKLPKVGMTRTMVYFVLDAGWGGAWASSGTKP